MRLPLQIGTAALWSLLRASALLVPTTLLTGAAVWLVVELELDGDAAGYVILLPLMSLIFAVKHLRRAWRQRPSDLELGADGLALHGGVHDGKRYAWAEVSGCTVVQPSGGKPDGFKVDEDAVELWRAQLGVRRGAPVVLGATDDEVERESLREAAAAIDAAAKARATPPTRADAPAEVLRCPKCHAPVRPSASETVTCGFCQAKAPVPAELREKVKAAQVVARRPARVVRAVLRQPRAGFVGGLYVFAALFMLTAWPVALAVLAVHFHANSLDWAGAGFLALFLVACLLGFFGLIRGLLVDRQALRVLLLRFAARAPEQAGQPPRCRGCDAPLPDSGKQQLVTCAYCAAPNVLALDFRSLAKDVEEERQSLERALQRRTRERWRWRAATYAGVALLVLSGWALRHGVSRPARVVQTSTP